MAIGIFVAAFFIILMVLVFINYRVNKDFKIEASWLALALTPVIIWQLGTGQLSEFSGFGLAFKLKEVSAQPFSIAEDGDRIEPEAVSADTKEGIGKISQLIRNRTAAVTLTSGRQHYYNNGAIQRYLEELTPYAFFKYVLVVDQRGAFLGLADAHQLLPELRNRRVDLVALLESGSYKAIPGIVTDRIASDASKRKALQIMDRNGLSVLPVVDRDERFIGIAERDKITSSIVVQLVSNGER